MIYLTVEQILFLHARLVTETGGSHGVRELGSLLSAVARPQASFDDQDLYPDLFTKAAALMDSLIRNHPFLDGNKRTGIAAAALFMRINGYWLNATNTELEIFAQDVTQSRLAFAEIATWLETHAVPAGKSMVGNLRRRLPSPVAKP
jgi:death-on-curing protein